MKNSSVNNAPCSSTICPPLKLRGGRGSYDWIKNTFIYDWLGKRSYAQCGEDLIAMELLKEIKKGSYLEIGAYHPKVFSNTYLFYKKGWRGTVVEPNEKMAVLYKYSRPGDLFVEAGIVTPPSPASSPRMRGSRSYLQIDSRLRGNDMDYYVFEEETRNTFDKKTAINYQEDGNKLIRIEKKKTIQLGEVLKKKVDLLSIDTEGLDEEIVKSLVKLKIRPKVIIVEGERAGRVLEKTNYKLVGLTGYSRIYLYTPLDSPFPAVCGVDSRGKGERRYNSRLDESF